ncbi:Na+/H+ antiporter NhaC family protein [Parahaliea mediterranea]|uniref:Na+/H+ antiporter NhaC-like C-terminal domain-containing protein n=1 Tax=Parahaliea mediterranea TaxID=651086 RepID=A0A939IIF6_9GAMM|nr:Na+/H+ antiporter NhaC family protein [Parahaliea mediterranea]MBN7796559.1 hypothetical protein [Parahaliea mediterranea]
MTSHPQPSDGNGFYLTRWAACVPLLLMVAPAIALSLRGVLSTDVVITGGVVGLMVGSLLARDKRHYWHAVTKTLGDPTGMLVFALFLIVGIYGKLLAESQLAEGLIWLSQQLHAGPALFALFTYVACSILGTAMGTSMGIVVILTPVLYPAAVAMGVHPAIAAGAILSGAATGDHFAPVSDTTIISASTQRYRYRDGCAEIGEVVRARLKYAAPAFLLSCLLYLAIGGASAQQPLQASAPLIGGAHPAGLIMLLPMLLVVIAAIAGRSVFEALTYGTFIGLLLALGCGLIDWHQVAYLEDRQVKGILAEGATQNLGTIIMIVLMMGAYGVMRAYGLLDAIVAGLKGGAGASARATELTLFGVTWLFNFLLVGLVARITVIAGPIVDELGRAQNLHPTRRANILDGVANSFSFVVPWHVWPLLMLMTIAPLQQLYPHLPIPASTDFFLSTYYPLLIWLVMLAAVLTGYGRRYEPRAAPPR